MQNTFDFQNTSSNENTIENDYVPSYLDAPMSEEDYDFLAQGAEQDAVDQFQSSLVDDFPVKESPSNVSTKASATQETLDQNVKKVSIERSKSEANLNDAKAKLTEGAETKRALAQASQSRAQARFVSGVETVRAQAQSVSFYAQAQHYQAQAQQSQAQASFISGPQTHQTLSAAAEHWARVEFTQGVQTKRTLAESKKLDMDRIVSLSQMIMQGAVIITLIIIFSVYFLF